MAKIELKNNEQLLGEQQASNVKKFMFLPQANPGKLYVTNQRVIFKATQGRLSSEFEHNLDEIDSFSVGIASAITLLLKNGESYKITGMFNKKLISSLQEAGITKKEK